MATPIWVFGPDRGLPSTLNWLINGSPDCSPELSKCFLNGQPDSPETEWEWKEVAQHSSYRRLGRKSTLTWLKYSKDPKYSEKTYTINGRTYPDHWTYYDDTATQLSRILKDHWDLRGPRAEWQAYYDHSQLIPQKYHSWHVRCVNLADAIEWFPETKAVYTNFYYWQNPNFIYHFIDHETEPVIEQTFGNLWPPESGNSPNGYLSEEEKFAYTNFVAQKIKGSYKLWVEMRRANPDIVCVDVDDFLDPQSCMQIYDRLGIARPSEEWVTEWLDWLKQQMNLGQPGNPDFVEVAHRVRDKLSGHIKSDPELDDEMRYELDRLLELDANIEYSI